jgi:hypothetical protein
MKKVILILALIIVSKSQSQELVSELNKDNKLEAIKVTVIKNKNKSEIYNSTLNWASYTFTKTESVLQAQVKDEMIRLSGVSNGVLDGPMGFMYGLGYTIQIEIKPNKLRFKIYDMSMIGVNAARTKTPMENVLLKRSGKKRKSSRYLHYKIEADKEINSIYISLLEHINNEQKKKSDW